MKHNIDVLENYVRALPRNTKYASSSKPNCNK